MVRFDVVILMAALLGAFAPSSAAGAPSVVHQASARDGQKDFDWETGTWTTRVKVRRNPLSGAAPDWAEYEGTKRRQAAAERPSEFGGAFGRRAARQD